MPSALTDKDKEKMYIIALIKKSDCKTFAHISHYIKKICNWMCDREVVLALSEKYPGNNVIGHATHELKTDEQFMSELVKLDGIALRHIDYDVRRSNKEVVLSAVHQNGLAYMFLTYMPTRSKSPLADDKDVKLAAVAQNCDAIRYMELRNGVLFCIKRTTSRFTFVIYCNKTVFRSHK